MAGSVSGELNFSDPTVFEAYRSGRRARVEGVKTEFSAMVINPYPVTTCVYRAWLTGWRDACPCPEEILC